MADEPQNTDFERAFLTMCKEEEIPIHLILRNGAKMNGFVVSFDEKVVLLNKVQPSRLSGEVQKNSMVYLHAIQSILPQDR